MINFEEQWDQKGFFLLIFFIKAKPSSSKNFKQNETLLVPYFLNFKPYLIFYLIQGLIKFTKICFIQKFMKIEFFFIIRRLKLEKYVSSFNKKLKGYILFEAKWINWNIRWVFVKSCYKNKEAQQFFSLKRAHTKFSIWY